MAMRQASGDTHPAKPRPVSFIPFSRAVYDGPARVHLRSRKPTKVDAVLSVGTVWVQLFRHPWINATSAADHLETIGRSRVKRSGDAATSTTRRHRTRFGGGGGIRTRVAGRPSGSSTGVAGG